MKAQEVLKQYAAGKRNFRGVNLRGESFKEKTLSGADFSETDLRSTDFTGATLRGANFTGANCGLQKRWATFLTIFSWLLTAISGFLSIFCGLLVSFIFDPNLGNQIADWVSLPVIAIFLILMVDQEIRVVAVAVVVAGAGAVVGAVAVAGAAIGAVAAIGAGAGAYIGWRAMKGDPKDAWVRSFAITFAAIGGTSFHGADLTDADFTKATLKSTNMKEATLTRVRWYGAEMLDRVRPGDTYLQSTQLRQWLIGEGKDKNFNGQKLQGINLQGADLSDASFINANLNEANLQDANLVDAKLIQTQLDGTNFTRATLTGACIEDWGITRNTRFEGVKGDYVYQKLPTERNRDPNRMPPSQQGNFGENDLYIFITSVLDTLDLYHRHNINAGVALAVLKGLTEDYPVKFELVAIEKRGDSQYVMKLKMFGQASHFQVQREYYDRYEQTLLLYDPKMLMPDSENIVENIVAQIIQKPEENPGTHIENLHNRGIVIIGGMVIIGEEVDMSGDRNINTETYYEQSGNFGIGYMSGGEIKDNARVSGVINEAEKQNLADAAEEIQGLLEQLSETYPTTTSREKNIVVGEAVEQIESNFTRKSKVINALKAGGTEALREAIDHPLGNIFVATIEGWPDK